MAVAVAASLATNCTLRELHLERNEIGLKGCKALAAAAVDRCRVCALWTLTLREQTPLLSRCDVRDVARHVDERHFAERVRVRLRLTGAWPTSQDLAGFGFRPPDASDDADGCELEPPVAVAAGDRVEVRWMQQRLRKSKSAWRPATVVSSPEHARAMVSVRYDGYCETVSPYLLRAQAVARPTEVPKERPQHVEYFGTDGTLRRMTFQHMANKLEFERPEVALLRLAARDSDARHLPDLARVAPDGASTRLTRLEACTELLGRELASVFVEPRVCEPQIAEDVAAALPASNACLLLLLPPELRERDAPVSNTQDWTDAHFKRAARDWRRSASTEVLF